MPERVLVIDDESTVLSAFKTALELAGYKVLTSPSPEAALIVAQESFLDLIVIDFIMPGMDGLELLARIRKSQPLVRSILISGKLDSEESEASLSKALGEQVEADLYLHKPVSNERLLGAVRAVLDRPEGCDWKEIAAQFVQRRAAPIRRAKTASKDLKKMLRKRR